MKLSFILAFVTSMVFGQALKRKFQITTYSAGIKYRKEVISIESKINSIDLEFMRKHFNIAYHLPKEFVNTKYKNESLVIWKDENDKDNLTTNWTKTYKYDSLSRISEYNYSGCTACSDFSYNYIVTYNSKNQIIELKNTLFTKEFYEIKYDTNEEIIELKSCSQDGETKKLIEILK